jgi:hypothetical protein
MPDFGKSWRPIRPPEASQKFTERVDELRSALLLRDPYIVAARSGAVYQSTTPGRGQLHVPFWGNMCTLAWPELIGHNHLAKPIADFQLALLFYYFLTADGILVSGKWISFADLPDGRVYSAAFQGYSGDELVKAFGLNLEAFREACVSAGGTEAGLASASFVFQPLPRVPLMVTYWLGDEDFPSSCRILYDETASHYLPIDACAILGSTLVRRLHSIT